jgi:hypothetical protein
MVVQAHHGAAPALCLRGQQQGRTCQAAGLQRHATHPIIILYPPYVLPPNDKVAVWQNY